MRPHLGLILRSSLVLPVLLVPSCTTPPSIPAPWEATEPQSAEPASVLPDAKPEAQWARIGVSIRGKQLLATTIGDGKHRIYIIGGIHGDEPEGPPVAARLSDLLTEAAPEHSTIRIVRDMNPDGTSSKTRANTRKVDLERNWPARDFQKDLRIGGSGDRPCSELETAAVYSDLLKFKPDIVIVFQSANLPPSVTFQGPGRMLAYGFASAARNADGRWRFNPEQRNRPPGSIESLFGGDQGLTVLRVEFQRNRSADLNAAAMLAGLRSIEEREQRPSSSEPATPKVSLAR